MKQTTFASLNFDIKKMQSRRERFLAEVEQSMPWWEMLTVIVSYYPTRGWRCRPAGPGR